MKELTDPKKMMICIVTHFGAGVFSRQELIYWMNKDFPRVAFIGPTDYCVNKSSTVAGPKFLYWIEEGKYRLFDRQRDPKEKLPKKR